MLALNWRRLPNLRATMDAGVNASALPAISVASLVGFGAVVAALPAFAMVRDAVLGIGGGPLVSLAVATNTLAALTGSASGGLTIALDALGATYLQRAAEIGMDPALLHRVAVIGSGTLDSLPHNGAVVTLLSVCGSTHGESYKDIFMVGDLGAIIALVGGDRARLPGRALSERLHAAFAGRQSEDRKLSLSGSRLPLRRTSRLLLLAAPALVAPHLRLQARDRAGDPPPRPVRTIVVQKGGLGQTIVLTGQIQAEKEVALAFRIGGRIIERSVDTGDRVTPDQVVARLDPQNELNTLRSARAALSAAQGRLEQDSNTFDRQQTLLRQGWTTRANFEQAQQALRSAQAAVDDAKAQVEIAEDRVSYTELRPA